MQGVSLHSSCHSLPLAAWQVVAELLQPEDALTARLVCHSWAQDLGSFVPVAKYLPAHRRSANSCAAVQATTAGASTASAVAASTATAAAAAGAGTSCSTTINSLATATGASAQIKTATKQHAGPAGVRDLLAAFPHCRTVHVDVCNAQPERLAAVLNTLAGSNAGANRGAISAAASAVTEAKAAADDQDSDGGSCCHASGTAAGGDDDASSVGAVVDVQQAPSVQLLQQYSVQLPQVCLDAVPRSFHCRARQDCPCAPAGASEALFDLLLSLPRELTPCALTMVHTLDLEVFPDTPSGWAALRGLPSLCELLLPPFKPALPHEHLPALAQITQLTGLTASVQGSVTSWRACCESFNAVSSLTRLQRLSMHAFHCPGRSLAAGLAPLVCLTELRLSGRVVLQPVKVLGGLPRLQTLELTQDMQYSVLCELYYSLPHLTQLAVGRVTLPPPHHQQPGRLPGVAAAVAAAAEAEANQWPLPAAAAVAADNGNDDSSGSESDAGDESSSGDDSSESEEGEGPPAAAAAAGQQQPAVAAVAAAAPAAVPPLPVMPFIAAAAHAPAADPGVGGAGAGGEVMLEDVGLIVDGLVGNLQEGAIPVHLQRIIERFESIIQLDLTRRGSSSPWAWPVGGLGLLREARGLSSWMQGAKADAGAVSSGVGVGANSGASSSSSGGGSGSSRGGYNSGKQAAGSGKDLGSLELALLKPSDVARLMELPAEMRATQHLGLRLRDQLLAFASVCALKLDPGQLAPLGHTFDNLASLSLSGKVSLDGQLLRELTTAFSSSSSRKGLQSLCLDVHFVGVGAEDVAAALQAMTQLKALSLRHRGAGKLLVPVTALPQSLTVLALKKVMIYCSSSRNSRHGKGRGSATTQSGQSEAVSAASSSGSRSSGSSGSSGACSSQQQQQQQEARHTPVIGTVQVDSPWDCSSRVESPSGCESPSGVESSELSYAITSPGFTRAALTGSISNPNLGALAQSAAFAAGGAAVDSPAAAKDDSRSGRDGCRVLLPNLRRLYLKLCFVPSAALTGLLGIPALTTQQQQQAHGSSCSSSSSSSSSGGSGVAPRSPLEVLSVTGDGVVRGEASEAWARWLQAMRHLKALQVLELSVPDHLGSCLPPQLLSALKSLPRLAHLHLTTSTTPQYLTHLATLTALRTLSISYTGPPALPAELLAQLQQGLGPYCRVQLWEQVVMQQQGSFGDVTATAAAGDAEGAGGAGPADGAGPAAPAAAAAGGGDAGGGHVPAAAAEGAGGEGLAAAVEEPVVGHNQARDAAAAAPQAGNELLAPPAAAEGAGGVPLSAAAHATPATARLLGTQAEQQSWAVQVTAAAELPQRRGVIKQGVRWLRASRVGRVLRVLSGGLLVFEAGRQLGWLAGRLSP